VLLALASALELRQARRETRTLRADLGLASEMIGSSPALRRVREMIAKVAPSDARVLITGESGTGKELVAAAIHGSGSRKDRPFVRVNCAAIPRDLVESEMFGHERGAFTGATDRRIGRFELADRGTLLLDEVGDLGAEAQAKLLRAIESGEIERVGGSKPIRVDVRILSATNKDLTRAVADGTFREDLYFRLSVVHVELPAMRERREDIPALANHFLRDVAGRRGMTMSFSQDAMAAMISHSWPGNVREMRNVVERAAALSDGPVITRADLVFGREMGPSVVVSHDLAQAGAQAAKRAAAELSGIELPQQSGPAIFDASLLKAGLGFKQAKQTVVDSFEIAYLQALMVRNDGNITRSAQEAGLTRYHLRELLKRHGLTNVKD
jgi:two-component system nitrogen regulation response regulator NtrX